MKKKKNVQPINPKIFLRNTVTCFLTILFGLCLLFYIPVLWMDYESSQYEQYREETALDCSNIPSDLEPIVATGITEFDASEYTTTVITQNNVTQLEQIGTFYLNRDRFDTNHYDYNNPAPITHPNVDYVLYPHFFSSYETRIAICGEDDRAMSVILKGENFDDIMFNYDGSFFMVSDSYSHHIRFFDAVTLDEIQTLEISEFIRDIALHPNLPIIGVITERRVTTNSEDAYDILPTLTLWNHETSEELARFELEETYTEIYFNQDGTAIINYSSQANTPIYIRGIP